MKNLVQILLLIFLFSGCYERQQNEVLSAPSALDTPDIVSIKPVVVVSSQPYADSVVEDFNTFWKGFREVALASDTSRLEKLILFPLKYRGTLDGDPVIKIPKKQFSKVFILFLKQWNGMDLEGSTELGYIKKTVQPTEQSNSGQIRMSNMVFHQKDGKWKLGFLYLNEETIDLIKKEK